jgi:hypothetical protein
LVLLLFFLLTANDHPPRPHRLFRVHSEPLRGCMQVLRFCLGELVSRGHSAFQSGKNTT